MTALSSQPVVSPAALPDLGRGAGHSAARPVRSLARVPMTVRVVLAHTTMTLGEIEALSPGDLIRLDRSPDATVDIFINGVHAAEGDVVVIDDMVAARISQLHVGSDDE